MVLCRQYLDEIFLRVQYVTVARISTCNERYVCAFDFACWGSSPHARVPSRVFSRWMKSLMLADYTIWISNVLTPNSAAAATIKTGKNISDFIALGSYGRLCGMKVCWLAALPYLFLAYIRPTGYVSSGAISLR